MMFALRPRSARALAHSTSVSNVSRRFMSVFNLSDNDAVEKFRKINDKSVLYFTASWCGPCKQIKPLYEEMSTKYADVSFGKVDVDENPDASAEFKISAVPTFVFFHGQEQTESFSGADPSKLESMVKDLQAK